MNDYQPITWRRALPQQPASDDTPLTAFGFHYHAPTGEVIDARLTGAGSAAIPVAFIAGGLTTLLLVAIFLPRR